MIRLIAAAFALLPLPALAHVGAAEGSGFLQGLVHPFSGLDHLLAMIAVGLWATQVAARTGRRALVLVPATFVTVMTAGAVAGAAGLGLPLLETGIAASVLVLGLCVALALPVPQLVVMVVVGLFAALHGMAHGAEMPEAAAPLAYGAGFVIATAALHAIGIGAGLAAGRLPVLARAAGGAIAAVGLFLVLG